MDHGDICMMDKSSTIKCNLKICIEDFQILFGAAMTAFDIHVDGKRGPGRPKMTGSN